MGVLLCSESQNQNTLLAKTELRSQSESTEKINLKTKIFLESKMLKHKKAAAANVKTFESNADPEKNEETVPKPAESPSAQAEQFNKGEPIADITYNQRDAATQSPVLFQGWVKYFKLSESMSKSLPKKFFRNGEYYEQMKIYPGVDYAAKNPKGEYNFIKNPDYFYLVVFKNLVSIFSSKQVNIKKNLRFFFLQNETSEELKKFRLFIICQSNKLLPPISIIV